VVDAVVEAEISAARETMTSAWKATLLHPEQSEDVQALDTVITK
jgi:hypothetical protein